MNVRDLITALQDMPQDAEVRLATQPNYPIAHTIADVVSPDDLAAQTECQTHGDYSCDDCMEEDGNGAVWITDGGHPDGSPYAPRAVFAGGWY